ncbi:uncharacterized protein LOC113567355 isoform X2 [Drosophila persimilis]|uniref:uncharacterized protein LOC113567355 isoform X2 n=1 Tax=Drosophila persimilis TaxID=7234 RepID=UPI000F095D45|nr:uncharacterized protein LOC113567355 isoform X2 [Drosophila persimilis]
MEVDHDPSTYGSIVDGACKSINRAADHLEQPEIMDLMAHDWCCAASSLGSIMYMWETSWMSSSCHLISWKWTMPYPSQQPSSRSP